MTQPTPDDAKAAAEKAAAEKAAKAKTPDPLSPLELVVYEHRDPILRRSHRAVGVVVDVDDQGVMVRPLASHDVRVALADVQRYDDVADTVDEV